MRVPVSLRWSALALLAVTAGAAAALAQAPEDAREQRFTVSARKYAFRPAIIEVRQDDLVRISLTTEDIPHSFTIDKYRIAKRVEPGRAVVFEFRADQPGRFPIYCNLTIDERCKDMHGELVVKPR